jgi:hypothetical protein
LGAFDQGGIGSSLVVFSLKKFGTGFSNMLKQTGVTNYSFLSEEDLKTLRNINTSMREFSRNDVWRNAYLYWAGLDESAQKTWETDLVHIITNLRELAIDVDEVNSEIIIFFRRVSYVPRTPVETYQSEAIKIERQMELQRMQKRIGPLSKTIHVLQKRIPLAIDALLLHMVGPLRMTVQYNTEYHNSPDELDFEKRILDGSNSPKISVYLSQFSEQKAELDNVEADFQKRIDAREKETVTMMQFAGKDYGQDGNLMRSRVGQNERDFLAKNKLQETKLRPPYKVKHTNFFTSVTNFFK